jgi:hypothetical protein
MRRTLLALLVATLSVSAETPAVAPAPTTPPPAAPATTAAPAKSTLTPQEQKQLRNARAKANKQPEVAAALKAEDEAYRVAKEAKGAKKPKAEVDALYAKARELRAAREKLRDAAILAANPALKPLLDKAARRGEAAPTKTEDAPAPAPEKKASEDEMDA